MSGRALEISIRSASLTCAPRPVLMKVAFGRIEAKSGWFNTPLSSGKIGQVIADDVGLREGFLHCDDFHAELLGGLGGEIRIDREDLERGTASKQRNEFARHGAHAD